MKFEQLLKYFASSPFFDWRELREFAFNSERQLANQLSQWTKQGKVIRLKQGQYLLAPRYRKFNPPIYYIANYLYRPSYVSLTTALQFYGLIPEAVGVIQSITPRHGREWDNPLGRFKYRSIKRQRFWGYREEVFENIPAQNRFFIARPEKAILDLMYLAKGEWTRERIGQMRFQTLEKIDTDRFREYSQKFGSPRVRRAGEKFLDLYSEECT